MLTFGHRNVQGLAQRADGTVWSVEHGTDRDDEVNSWPRRRLRLEPGAGLQRERPDDRPGPARHPIAAGGAPASRRIATSGAAWVRGTQWGLYNGMLAVAALKG